MAVFCLTRSRMNAKIPNTAAMDDRFLILTFTDECISQRFGRLQAPMELQQ